MKHIAIFGAGGFGREIACLIRNNLPEWNIIGYFDDGKEKGAPVSPFGTILGGISELNAWNDELAIVIAIGNSKTVRSLVEKIVNPNIIQVSQVPNLPVLIGRFQQND